MRIKNDGWISLVYPEGSGSLLLRCVCLTLVAVYVASVVNPELIYAGDLNATALSGEWWRFGSSLLLHANLLHIGFNVIALWSLGILAEQFFSKSAWFSTFIVGGIVGGVTTLLVLPQAHLIGASGGIFAIFGMCIAPQIRAIWCDRDELWSAPQQVFVRSWIFLLILNAILGFVLPNIGWQAHAGGLLAGLIMGMIVPLKGKLTVRSSRPGIVKITGTRALRRHSSETQLAQLRIQKREQFDESEDYVVLVAEDLDLLGRKKYRILDLAGSNRAKKLGKSLIKRSILLAEPIGFKQAAIQVPEPMPAPFLKVA